MSFVGIALLSWVILSEFAGWGLGLVGAAYNPEVLGHNFRLANLIGLGMAIVMTLYVKRRYATLAMEIGNELSRVTWPTWSETRLSTIVVIIVTIIIALILGAFDYVWAQLSSLVYDI
jgi:preprotein translocase subunit SecE